MPLSNVPPSGLAATTVCIIHCFHSWLVALAGSVSKGGDNNKTDQQASQPKPSSPLAEGTNLPFKPKNDF